MVLLVCAGLPPLGGGLRVRNFHAAWSPKGVFLREIGSNPMRIVSKAHSKELHTAQQKPGRLGGAGRDNDVAAPEDGTGCNPAICLTSFFKEPQSRM